MNHPADSRRSLRQPRPTGCLLAVAAVFLLAGSVSAAPGDDQRPPQAARPPAQPGRPHSFEIFAGGDYLAPQPLGTSVATMVANNTSSTPYNYFTASGTRAAAPAVRFGIGYTITRTLTVEGRLVAGRGTLQTTISSDVENATSPAITSRSTQYVFDASVLAHLPKLAFAGGAGVPYLVAGAGYLRQMHEGNLAVDAGSVFNFGGGVRYVISSRPTSALSGIGIRADVRVYVPRGGYSFDSNQHVFAAVGGGLLLMF